MPILDRQEDIYPADLLAGAAAEGGGSWWCLYTMARREKALMRQLLRVRIPFYGPLVARRTRAPSGRIRTSFVPLFPGYVFLRGDESQRADALRTQCVSRWTRVADSEGLVRDLRQIRNVIEAGVPITPEARLTAGDWVRVRLGPFAGYEGTILRREGKTRLLLAVRFLERGVSMEMDEGLLEPVT
jgi:transcription antitermination factor NusG